MTNQQDQKKNKFLQSARKDSFADSMDRDYYNEDANDNPPPAHPSLLITRRLTIPDMVRVDRCHRLPEYAPRILFFSGGSALRQLSRVLKHYTHNSIHLITPFDSGGSSAILRDAFHMLSVGDLRNRLMALSDESALVANPQVTALLSHRLTHQSKKGADTEFQHILSGQHSLICQVKLPLRSILISHLRWFATRCPPAFDLRGASLGNLIIVGCFLEHDRDIVTAIFWIGKLLGVNGIVRPVTGANLHIRAHYKDNVTQVGQHLLGKQPKRQKIQAVDLVESLQPPLDKEPAEAAQVCHMDRVSAELVDSADVICFPMGSFFGSVLANLLPRGVGQAIVQRQCPKIYIPNTGDDPEMYGYTLLECVEWIIQLVRRDCDGDVEVSQILTTVLVDTVHCEYCVEIDKAAIEKLGVVVLDIPLVTAATAEEQELEATQQKATKLDPTKVAEVLLTLGS